MNFETAPLPIGMLQAIALVCVVVALLVFM